MKRVFLASATILLASAGSASALQHATANWGGCHVGGQAGLASGHTHWSDTSADGAIDSTGTGQTASSDMSGGIYGGQIGCDYQFGGNWVAGLEGEYAGANLSGTNQDQFNSTWTLKTQSDWIGSITGRLGWAAGDVLLYGRGGIAFTNNKFDIENTGFNVGTPSQTRVGFELAPGLEWQFAPQWSVFTEFDYYQFDGKNTNFAGNTSAAATAAGANTPAFEVRTTQNIESLKFGINYHF